MLNYQWFRACFLWSVHVFTYNTLKILKCKREGTARSGMSYRAGSCVSEQRFNQFLAGAAICSQCGLWHSESTAGPAIVAEGDRTCLLYAVAGESGIAIAELHF